MTCTRLASSSPFMAIGEKLAKGSGTAAIVGGGSMPMILFGIRNRTSVGHLSWTGSAPGIVMWVVNTVIGRTK